MDIALNTATVVYEVMHYASVFDLAITDLAKVFGVVGEDASQFYTKMIFKLFTTSVQGVSVAAASSLDDVLKLVPLLGSVAGSVLGAVTSFFATHFVLTKALDIFVSQAKEKLVRMKDEVEQIQ